MRQVERRGWGDGLAAMRLEAPRWLGVGELSTGHEFFADPLAQTPEQICTEKELRAEATRLLSSGMKLSHSRRVALQCFVEGGNTDDAMHEYYKVRAKLIVWRLGKSVIAPFQPRV